MRAVASSLWWGQPALPPALARAVPSERHCWALEDAGEDQGLEPAPAQSLWGLRCQEQAGRVLCWHRTRLAPVGPPAPSRCLGSSRTWAGGSLRPLRSVVSCFLLPRLSRPDSASLPCRPRPRPHHMSPVASFPLAGRQSECHLHAWQPRACSLAQLSGKGFK